MTMTKKQIVASLREQRASLLTRRDKLDEQIEQTETALAAFGVTNPSRPAKAAPTGRTRQHRTEAEREQHTIAALELAEGGGCSVAELSAETGLHHSTAWRVLEDLRAAEQLYREQQEDRSWRYFPLAARAAGVNPATKLPNGPAFPDATDATGDSARASVTT